MTKLLNDQEIRDCITNWFENKTNYSDLGQDAEEKVMSQSNDLWEKLQGRNNYQLKELATNPVLLDALLEHYYCHPLTKSHSAIYAGIFKVLLKDYQIEMFLRILQTSAFKLFQSNKNIFPATELVPSIEYYLRQYRRGVNPFNVESILYAFCLQGILIKIGDDYSFSHPSFIDYFSARYIYENDLTDDSLISYFPNLRYRNIFLFLAEMLRKKTEKSFLIMATHYSINKNPYVKNLLLECKQRSKYINKEIWQLIEKSL